MRIGLLDVDSYNFPNLALMKLSSFHKKRGDVVSWWDATEHYDIVYKAKVFSSDITRDVPDPTNCSLLVRGGTGYVSTSDLPSVVESAFPDYGIYPQFEDTAYGFLTRGCPRGCGFCIVSGKEGTQSRKVADLVSFWSGQSKIKLLDPNILACSNRIELLTQLVASRAIVDFTQGLDIRLVTDEIVTILNEMRIRTIHFAWDDPTQDLVPAFKEFSAKYCRKSPQGKFVYVLTNWNSTLEQDLYRIYKLRELRYDPYVMIYDKANADISLRKLQRWVNNRRVWRNCPKFESYEFAPKGFV